jgi:hypothetical protein
MNDEPPVNRAQQFWLAQPTETFRLGTGDLAKRVGRFERDARNARVQVYVGAFFPVAMWLAMLVIMPALGARIGALLALVGWVYVIQQVTSHSRRAIETCMQFAERPVASFYRDGLERERAFLSGARFWLRWLSMVAGPAVFCAGIAIHDHRAIAVASLIAVVWIALTSFAIPFHTTKLAHIRKQLDELHLYDGMQP